MHLRRVWHRRAQETMVVKSKRALKIAAFSLIGAVCVLSVASVALLRGSGHASGDAVVGQSARRCREVERSVRGVSHVVRRPKTAKPTLGFGANDEDDLLTPAEKALAERIEKAFKDEDFESAASCAEEAQKCGDSEIRQAMVDTLGWFGEKALPELTPFLADPDEDVRESAMNEWTMAMSSIEDDKVKIKTVELAMGVLNDEDALEEISNEYIGADEKLAVESLARIIEGGGSKEGVEKAKETYEFVTGDEWTDAAEAERWIAEEYEPPEEP